MIGKLKISFVLYLLFGMFARPGKMAAQEYSTKLYFQDQEQTSITLPFQYISNLIIITMKINQSDTLRFVLDSGLRTALITDLDQDDSLYLNYARKVKVYGLGGGEALEAYHSYGNQFFLRGIKGNNQTLYVLLDNIFDLSARLGMKIHGLVGHDLFRDFIVEINYHSKFITFYRPEAFSYKRRRMRKFSTIPLELHQSKPYIDAEIDFPDQHTSKVKLLVDTGASDAIWLFPNSSEHIEVPGVHMDSFLGKGLNGEVYGKKARIAGLKLGKYTLDQPVVAFPDTSYVNKYAQLYGRNGSIGSEVLRRFTVIFDYPNRKISFRKNSDILDPFTHNMGGLEITNPMPGLPFYEISDVRFDSPAHKAGLREGDQILSINYKNAFEYTLSEINSVFFEKEGKRVRMKVLRDGETLKTSFRLLNEI